MAPSLTLALPLALPLTHLEWRHRQERPPAHLVRVRVRVRARVGVRVRARARARVRVLRVSSRSSCDARTARLATARECHELVACMVKGGEMGGFGGG